MDDITPKRRPGRPKKDANIKPVPVSGIAAIPMTNTNIVEMTYSNPKLFKKVFSVFKNYSCPELIMIFSPTIVQIEGKDHTGSCTVQCNILCKNLNHYYCGQTTHVTIKRDELERIINTFDKNQSTISFIISADSGSALFVVTTDTEFNSRDTSKIELLETSVELSELHKDFPIKFTLSGKHFKKKIGDISKIADDIVFHKGEEDGLVITSSDDSRNTVQYDSRYTDYGKIKYIGLEYKYTASVRVKYIKPFSSTSIGNDVDICINLDDNILQLSTSVDRRDSTDVFYITVQISSLSVTENTKN